MTGPRDVPALVFGDGYTALASARALGRAGVRVLQAAADTGFAGRSRYVRGTVSGVAESSDGVLAAARSLGVERAVLVPCSDTWCEAIVRLPADAGRFVTSLPPADVVAMFLDKARFAEYLRGRDILHPHTVSLRGPADLAVMDERGGEWILKPRSSYRFNRMFRRKGFRVQARAEAELRLAECTAAGQTMVLQEYVPGPPSAHVLIDAFYDRTGIARVVLARRRQRMYPTDLGDSAYGVFVSPRDAAEPIRILGDLLAELPYRGIVNAEFIADPREGAHALLEVNCRPFSHVGFGRRWGTDLSLMAYCDALGLPLPPARPVPAGVPYGFAAIEFTELVTKARRRDLDARGLVDRLVALARAPTDPDDPLPAVFHVAQVVRASLRRSLER